jgi:hypothetical protein
MSFLKFLRTISMVLLTILCCVQLTACTTNQAHPTSVHCPTTSSGELPRGEIRSHTSLPGCGLVNLVVQNDEGCTKTVTITVGDDPRNHCVVGRVWPDCEYK